MGFIVSGWKTPIAHCKVTSITLKKKYLYYCIFNEHFDLTKFFLPSCYGLFLEAKLSNSRTLVSIFYMSMNIFYFPDIFVGIRLCTMFSQLQYNSFTIEARGIKRQKNQVSNNCCHFIRYFLKIVK